MNNNHDDNKAAAQRGSMDDSSRSIAREVKKVGKAYSIYRIINTSILSVILIAMSIFFMYLKIPFIICIVIIAIAIGIVVLEVITYKRVSSADMKVPDTKPQSAIAVDHDERIVYYIPGIMRVGAGSGSYSVMGKGRSLSPENAIIISKKNIWFVTVPLEGAGQVILEADISQYQWMFEQSEIENKLKNMTSSMTLTEIVQASERCFSIPFSMLKTFKTSDLSQSITFITMQNQKHHYCIRNREDYKNAVDYFSGYPRANGN